MVIAVATNGWIGCVRADRAVVAIDLADEKQAIVVTDHDSRVLARRRVRARAWELGATLEWAAGEAARAGLPGLSWRASRPVIAGG